jgi:hypothetical protein
MNNSLMTSLALKAASMVLIVSTFVDIIFGILPYRFDDGMWWAAATAGMVKSGPLPLLGVILWVIASWIENVSKDGNSKNSGKGSLIISIFSAALGFLFLIIMPFQAWSSNSQYGKVIAKSKEQATALEAELKQKANPTYVKQIIASIDTEIKGGKVQGQNLQQLQAKKAELEKYSNDPAKLAELSKQDLAKIRKNQEDINGQATAELWRGSERTGSGGIKSSLASLLLAAGYGFIGLMGLRAHRR